MRQAEHIFVMKSIVADLEFAQLTRKLLCYVRDVDESDVQTIERVIQEYQDARYDGKPIGKDWRERVRINEEWNKKKKEKDK